MEVERVASRQAICFVGSKSIEKKRYTDAMQVIIAFGQVSRVNVLMNMVFSWTSLTFDRLFIKVKSTFFIIHPIYDG